MPKGKITRRDELTTVAELRSLVDNFVTERDWAQFHSPKNLAMPIGVEAGELMDLFRWHSEAQSVQAMKNGISRRRAAEELADVVICTLDFANRTGINLGHAVSPKCSRTPRDTPYEATRGGFRQS
jgi:dCTP diphosphatase